MNKISDRKSNMLLILMLLVLFIAIDLILGQIFIKNTNRTFRSRHFYYHHGLLPNKKAMATWHTLNYPVFTNSLGFRDTANRQVSLSSGKKRILFMGDSHTEGVGMSFSETFTGQLIENSDTSKIEILNAAAVSYSPRIHYLKTKFLLEETGLKFDELFVFVDLSDIQNEIVYENYQPENPDFLNKLTFQIKNNAVNLSFTAHATAKIKTYRQTAGFLEKAAQFDEYRKDITHVDALELYASFFSEYDNNILLANPKFHGVSGWLYDDDFIELAKKGLELGKENLILLNDLCREHDIKMHISVHPWQEQIAMGEAEDMYVRFWKNFAEEYNIGFINLYPVFINPPVSAALGKEYFISGDNHWNKEGHWLVATELNKYLSNKIQ
jgi:hypothetical protein